MNSKKSWERDYGPPSTTCEMQNFMQRKPYRLAVPNDINDLRDFDSISKLATGACAEFFEGARKCAFGIFILWGSGGTLSREDFTT